MALVSIWIDLTISNKVSGPGSCDNLTSTRAEKHLQLYFPGFEAFVKISKASLQHLSCIKESHKMYHLLSDCHLKIMIVNCLSIVAVCL